MGCGIAEWLILLCTIDTMVFFVGQKNDNCSIMHFRELFLGNVSCEL